MPDSVLPQDASPLDPKVITGGEGRPTLSVARLSKAFGTGAKQLQAVQDVSFQIPHGEICMLLGPSGCGKSTILRMVAGLEARSAGSIHLNDRLVTGPGRDRGMVFQAYTSFPWLTVYDNVAFGLHATGQATALRENVADYFLERVGLTRFRDHYPDQLSGGMRQRVALARTLANGPELLLMDEPFGALDPETRWQMQELLLEIASKERMTVLMVTHDVEEAVYLGDRVVFLSTNPGRVREIIEPGLRQSGQFTSKDEVIDHPRYLQLYHQIMRMMREEHVGPV